MSFLREPTIWELIGFWNLIIIILGSLSITILLFLIKRKTRTFIKAIIVQKENRVFFKIKEKHLKMTTEIFDYKKCTYQIDFDMVSYLDGKRPTLFYEKGVAEPIQVSMSNDEKLHRSASFNILVRRKVIEQIVFGLKSGFALDTLTIIFIIMALSLGIALGYVIGLKVPIT